MNKNLSRFFVILATLSILACMLVAPVSASSDFYDSALINYFDYSNIPVNYTLTQDNNTIEFPLTRVEYIRYVDFLIFCNESYGLSNVTLNRGTVSNDLTILSLGSGYYRCYGQFSGGSSSYTDNPSLTFSFSSNSAFVQILSFKYTNFVIMRFKEVARMGVLGTDHPAAVSMEDANTPLYFYENADYENFSGSVYLDNWRKYDYLDVLIRVNSVGLTSLYVDIGGIKIPFEINFFDSSFGAISWVNSDYGAEEWHYTFLGEQSNVEFISIRLDLSTVNKIFSEVPVIHFNGNWSKNIGTSGMISLQEVTGIYKVDNITPLSYWFTNLKEFLKDLFSPEDEVKQDIDTGISNNESTEQDIITGIDDVGSDPGDIDIDVVIDESGADTNLIAAFFSVLLNNIIILRTFWLAALFIVIGYIFHGQR